MTHDNENQRRADLFAKTLSQHGYGFQYCVLKRAEDLNRLDQSVWEPKAAEFPVAVQGYGTRIDFVLRSRSGPNGYGIPVYLVC